MPMIGRGLLDTNIVIALFGGEQAVVEQLSAVPEVFVPCVVLGELYYGARRSARVADNVARIDDFAAASEVLPCTLGTARWYGVIKNQLRSKGRPVPENDIWIAALARQHSLTVLSRDKHFSEVADLSVAVW